MTKILTMDDVPDTSIYNVCIGCRSYEIYLEQCNEYYHQLWGDRIFACMAKLIENRHCPCKDCLVKPVCKKQCGVFYNWVVGDG